jgi:hypothetical protein
MKHAIYGTLTFASGLVITWLRFIPQTFTLTDAKPEAMRIVLHNIRAWASSPLQPHEKHKTTVPILGWHDYSSMYFLLVP